MSDETVRIDDGGPAFPRPRGKGWDDDGEERSNQAQVGMSVRAYFAAKAMQAALNACVSQPHTAAAIAKQSAECGSTQNAYIAKIACDAADALIAELRKAGGK